MSARQGLRGGRGRGRDACDDEGGAAERLGDGEGDIRDDLRALAAYRDVGVRSESMEEEYLPQVLATGGVREPTSPREGRRASPRSASASQRDTASSVSGASSSVCIAGRDRVGGSASPGAGGSVVGRSTSWEPAPEPDWTNPTIALSHAPAFIPARLASEILRQRLVGHHTDGLAQFSRDMVVLLEDADEDVEMRLTKMALHERPDPALGCGSDGLGGTAGSATGLLIQSQQIL